jgi:hypothetical protein
MSNPTPPHAEQAPAQPDGQRRRLTDQRDRRVHALATALLGAVLGVVMASQNILAGPSGTALRTFGYLAVVAGALAWTERAADTVPRHAKLASRVGLGTSLVVGLTSVLPWLNLSAQTRPNTLAMAAVGAAAIALPSWLAAATIAWPRR